MTGIFLMTGCTFPSMEEEKRYTATFLDVFDTRTEIVGYGTEEEEFLAQAEQLREKLWEYHRLYDIYETYDGINNIKTINEQAGIAPVVVDQKIIELLQFSKEMYGLTDGRVNAAMGSVLSIWHDYREFGSNIPFRATLPEMEVLQEAANLSDPPMSLDVGGIGKGYAVQKTAEYARELGMENLLISVGGNVIAVGGKKDGALWKIGVTDPDGMDATDYAAMVHIKDRCVVTSGNYQRYYVVDGKKYCHIIDPDTLMPADTFASVTIITKDSGVADALSTAVYIMPLEDGLDFINSMEDTEAMWIMEDGSIHYSAEFENLYLEKVDDK